MRIGVDLGGTKIEALALGDHGEELGRQRVPTPRSYQGTLQAIAELVRQLEAGHPERGTVGVGIPGAIIPRTGLVKNANSAWLIGQSLRTDLEIRLGRPVRIENDANCFALSEATDGAAAGASMVFGVIMGTGVGGGIVTDGQGHTGPNLIAGEWGHNPLPWPTANELPGPRCYCGKDGCIETWISGPAIVADHARRGGGTLSVPAIWAAAAEGDATADATRAALVHRTARSLATVINLLDPDVIVLGGGVSNTPGLIDDVTHALPAWVFSSDLHTRVVRNRFGDSSGVRGAAWLWPAPVVRSPSEG